MREMPYSYDKNGSMHIECKVDRPGRIPDFVNNYSEYWFEEMVKSYSTSSGEHKYAITEICPVTGLLVYFDGNYGQCWVFDKAQDANEAYQMWIDKRFEEHFTSEEGT